MEPDSCIPKTTRCIRSMHPHTVHASNAEVRARTGSHQLPQSSNRDVLNCLSMLHVPTQLKTILMHLKHLPAFLPTGDDQEATVVRLGNGQSTMTSAICIWVYLQHTVKHKIILCVGGLWKPLCSCSRRAT